MAQAHSFDHPKDCNHFYGGAWHAPKSGRLKETYNPATGAVLAKAADGTADDVDAAAHAARTGFEIWRQVPPLERASLLRKAANLIRENAAELAFLDALNGGNPVRELALDMQASAILFDFFAGLVTEMKGQSIPMGPDAVNFSVREPLGVIARLNAYNHPFMFAAAKAAAPLAAGNALIIKPPEQAPLSSVRLAELIGDVFPPGVFNVVLGGAEVGAALCEHSKIAMVGLIGSVPTGKAVMRGAASTIKRVALELGGKNALIACDDADPDEVADAVIAGMNFGWCGQSCGSTSRAFLHEGIHDEVLSRVADKIGAFRPGVPTDPHTSMGAIISDAQHRKILTYISLGLEDGAKLVYGGKKPDDRALEGGWFIEPTIFKDVTPNMRIAREEIFGPVLSVLKWSNQDDMLAQVNAVDYGLTCAIWTNDVRRAHRLANSVEAGFVWVNEVSKHFIGVPFGGYKQSGLGREECLEELLACTQEKNIHLNLRRRRS